MADVDAPKMEMYNLGKDWIVIYTKDGRPYYYNQETEETTWVHPSTGVALYPRLSHQQRPGPFQLP